MKLTQPHPGHRSAQYRGLGTGYRCPLPSERTSDAFTSMFDVKGRRRGSSRISNTVDRLPVMTIDMDSSIATQGTRLRARNQSFRLPDHRDLTARRTS